MDVVYPPGAASVAGWGVYSGLVPWEAAPVVVVIRAPSQWVTVALHYQSPHCAISHSPVVA